MVLVCPADHPNAEYSEKLLKPDVPRLPGGLVLGMFPVLIMISPGDPIADTVILNWMLLMVAPARSVARALASKRRMPRRCFPVESFPCATVSERLVTRASPSE